mmetsp:Transcript_37531/g.58625  ORF Transcript_37531/g.58625 Transcript_37531/m.58625 type:complete len:177 (-) Transcript_37531:245-775(-)
MGGGKAYHGAHHRTSWHHHQVSQVMTREGADLWMLHMRAALDKADLTDDPRVRPCIDGFLETHMKKYAEQFDFDEQGIDYSGNGGNVKPKLTAVPPNIEELSVSELKQVLEYKKVDYHDCIEKEDLLARLYSALTVKDCVSILKARGVNFSDCIEKREFLDLVKDLGYSNGDTQNV